MNHAGNNGCTPLIIVAQLGSTDVVVCLVKELGADINQADDNGSTPINIAVMNGHFEIFWVLAVEHGIDLGHADNEGHSPLVYVHKSIYKHAHTHILPHE